MQLQIERAQSGHPILQHLEHFIRGHSVSGDFEREVIGILHLFRDAVPQITENNEVVLERGADLFGRFPHCFALSQVSTLL